MGQSSTDHTVIDVRDLEGLFSRGSFISSECCIYKVPKILFRHDPNAYVPNAFSIGPLHHSQEHLKATEEIKVQYLNGLLSRNEKQAIDQTHKNLIKAVSEIQVSARLCYSVPFDFTPEEFVSILVLDGCFIIELFLRYAARFGKDRNKSEEKKDDLVFDMACMLQFLNQDLILLENQIPWLVLNSLFNAAFLGSNNPPPYSLTELVIEFFSSFYSKTSISPIGNNHGSKHILDLLRNTLVLSSKHKKGQIYDTWKQIPSAASLREAGIKFKKGKSSNILNVEFNGGELEIPPLLIQETTNALLRNLIAFEQCYPKCNPYITSYAILLNNLIASTKDISVLREEEIVDNWLNLDDCFQFFSKLYHDTYVKEFYYMQLCIDVNKHCQLILPRWRASLVQNHLGKPWAIVSVVVGAIVLILTFLQAYAAMKYK